jgi:hypothetical protein
MELDERDIRALVQAAGGPGDERPQRGESDDHADGPRGARNNNRRRGGRNGGPRPSGPGNQAVPGAGQNLGRTQRRKDRAGARATGRAPSPTP